MTIFYKVITFLVVVLPILYLSQGAFYPVGSLVSQLFLFIYLLICFFFVIKFLLTRSNKNTLGITILLFYSINFIYWLFSDKILFIAEIGEYVNTFSSFKNITFVFMTFFPFYYLSKENIISEKNIKVFSILFFIVSILSFMYSFTAQISDIGSFTNNASYMFVSFIPLVLIWKNKIFSFVLIFISYIFIILSVKRGAIIIGTVEILLILIFMLNDFKTSLKIKLSFLILFTISILSTYLIKFYNNNDYFQLRLEQTLEGNTSLRDELYSSIFQYWLDNGNFIYNLFGFGFNSSLVVSDNYAHNDWLEILIGQGIFGVFIYLLFFINMVKYIVNKNLSKSERMTVFLIFIAWVTRSMISMGYIDMNTFIFTILLGYIIGKNNLKNLEVYDKQNL